MVILFLQRRIYLLPQLGLCVCVYVSGGRGG